MSADADADADAQGTGRTTDTDNTRDTDRTRDTDVTTSMDQPRGADAPSRETDGAARSLHARVLLTLGEHVVVANHRGQPWYFLLGGHVAPGEGIEETLHRVLRRTAGFELRSLDFVGAVEHVHRDDRLWHRVDVVFAGAVPRYAEFGSRLDDVDMVTLPQSELATARFRPAHVQQMIINWVRAREPRWYGPRNRT